MSKVKIVVGNEMTLFEKDTEIIIGLYVECGDECFPNAKWTDFVQAVLGMWAHQLISNENSSNVEFILYFMDGPFRIDTYKDEKMNLVIKCVNSRKEEQIEYVIQCSYYELVEALYRAFKNFSFILFSKNMHNGKYKGVYEQTNATAKELNKVLKRGCK